jgi:hypothetical protein
MVRRFECPFCSRRRAAKKAVAEHLGRCWLNPAVRSCKTCAHLDEYDGGDTCFPGRPCDCNAPSRSCRAGVKFEENGLGPDFPVTGCPLWKLREEAPDGA